VRRTLQLLALVPVPIVVGLVLWAGRRPQPQLQLPAAKGGRPGGAAAPSVTLPAAPAVGWQLQGAATRYDEKTLFDRIDGAAPVYLRSGFVYSLGGEYKKQGAKEPVIVDVYDMGGASRALGIYATERDQSYRFLEVGDEGYAASGSLNLWRGRFYVKLAGFEQTEAMDRDLAELARGLAAALPEEKGAARELAPLALLPAEDRLAHGRGYAHAPLGDVDGLAGVHWADYKEGEAGYRLFLVREEAAAAAAARFEKARAYFKKDRARVEEGEAENAKTFAATAESSTTLLLLAGRVLAGGVDLPAQPAELLPRVRSRLLASIRAGVESAAPRKTNCAEFGPRVEDAAAGRPN
jgi:hypothetical protein